MIDYATFQRIQHLHRVEQLTVAQIALAMAMGVPPELLAHISPLGWAHILLTGEYRWPRTVADTP